MFIVIKKKILILIVVIIALAIAFPMTIFAVAGNSTVTKGVRLVIDAGHGGIDFGVQGVNTKVKESELTLAIAKLLNGYAESGELAPVMTRKNSDGLYGLPLPNFKRRDLNKRIKIIEEHNPELVISLHMNYYSASSRRGIQIFYSKDEDRLLAECLQNAINRTMNMPTLGRNFTEMKGDYFISKYSPCPAVIVECGFISNPEDEKLLLDADYRMLLAYQIFSAVILYLETKSPNS
ncbi:MAG: N-acetylmuramoyl-L-alanine amidase [Clostridia bacterium]|nr:N-acetylmuramoyl-L-alanine amidase [Clostridia bacterium]